MDTVEGFMMTRPPTARRPLLGLTGLWSKTAVSHVKRSGCCAYDKVRASGGLTALSMHQNTLGFTGRRC